LTEREIDGLTCKPGQKDQLYFDDVQRGLAVRVTAAGSKSYLAQYTIGGTKRRIPLASVDALSLAKAREAVAAIMGDVAKGMDPAAQRKAEAAERKAKDARDGFTLSVLIEDWERLHLSAKRGSYAVEAVRALRNGFAKYLDLPAAELDRKAVVKVVDGIAASGSATMAGRLVAYGSATYNWAVKRGSLSANPFLTVPVAATPKRERVLSDDELAEIWRATDPATTFGAIVRTLILTGQRREEVGGMTWGEVAADLSTWTLAGVRAKNGATHLVPLSAPVVDLLKTRVRGRAEDFVFPGRTGAFNGWSKSKERLDTTILKTRQKTDPEAQSMPEWRLHDLRRTLATGLQRLGVRLEVTESVLNHVSGSGGGIVGVYQRHDWATEKRAALDAWGEHVKALVEAREPAGNVVKLAAR
jgi:integrase